LLGLRLAEYSFSSGSRDTRYSRDWSSDVCSSDLNWSTRWVWQSPKQKRPDAVPREPAVWPKKSARPRKHGLPRKNAGLPKRSGEIGRASCRDRVPSSVGGIQVYQHAGHELLYCEP